MALQLQPPVLVDPPDELSAEDRRRLTETVRRAIARAVVAEGVEGEADWGSEPRAGPDAPPFAAELPGAPPFDEPSERGHPQLPDGVGPRDASPSTSGEPALDERASIGPAADGEPTADAEVANTPAADGEPTSERADADEPAASPVDRQPAGAKRYARARAPRAAQAAPPTPDEATVPPAGGEQAASAAPPSELDDPLGLPQGPTLDAGHGDRVVRAAFPRRVVAWGEGQPFFVGGSPYAVTGNWVRAGIWGRALFGGRGYAVLHSPRAPSRFYAVGMEEPLTVRDLGGVGGEADDKGVFVIGRPRTTRLVSTDFTVVAIETVEDWGIFWTNADAQWSLAKLRKIAAAIPAEEQRVDPTLLSGVAEQLLPSADESAAVDVLVNMDRTMFAAMPWERRAEFLRMLVDAWTQEREEIAILEIIHATRSTAELEAIFAILRQRGVYARLFRDLDGRVFDLLVMLGEFRAKRAPTWEFLVEVLMGSRLLSPSSQPSESVEDELRVLVALAEGAEQWLRDTLKGLWDMLSRPDLALEGLAHLVEMLWTFEKARWGDREARAVIREMALTVGKRAAAAFDGLEYADELGTSIDARGGAEHASGAIIGRIRGMVAIECASWFVGIGEIKAALEAASVSERIAALAKALRSLRLLGRLGRATASTARIERVLLALGRTAKIDDVARLARIAQGLPEMHLQVLQRMVEHADLPAGATTEALRAALRSDPKLLAALDPLIDTFGATARLEARAEGAGTTLTELLPGLHRLVQDVELKAGELAWLIDEVPAANLREFMQAVQFMSPELAAGLRAADLAALARRPAAIRFLLEAGSEVFEVVLRAEGRDWGRLEEVAGALERHRATIPAADDWQRFLDRIKAGDQAALEPALEGGGGLTRLPLPSRDVLKAQLNALEWRFGAEIERSASATKLYDELDEVRGLVQKGDLNEARSRVAQLTARWHKEADIVRVRLGHETKFAPRGSTEAGAKLPVRPGVGGRESIEGLRRVPALAADAEALLREELILTRRPFTSADDVRRQAEILELHKTDPARAGHEYERFVIEREGPPGATLDRPGRRPDIGGTEITLVGMTEGLSAHKRQQLWLDLVDMRRIHLIVPEISDHALHELAQLGKAAENLLGETVVIDVVVTK